MVGDSATAFLPNFVGFPSPWGLHSSTVQALNHPMAPERTPLALRRTTPKRPVESCLPHRAPRWNRWTSCPVSAASAASAPAAPARGPAAAGRPAPAGVPAAATVPATAVVVPAASAVGAVGRTGPPTARRAGRGTTTGAPALATPLAPARTEPRHQSEQEHRTEDEGQDHGHHAPSVPPKQVPRGPRFSRDREMPPPTRRQSRVEELQRFGAGWRP